MTPPVRPVRAGTTGREVGIAALIGAAVAGAAVGAAEMWSLPAAALVVGALAVGGVLVATRIGGVDRSAVVVLIGAVAAAPANAVKIGGLPAGATLLAAALAGLLVATVRDRRPIRIPAWVWPLPVAITVVAALHVLDPTALSYLAARVIDPDSPRAAQSAAELADAAGVGVVTGAQWLVAALALPIAVCLAAVRRPWLPGRLADAWALGAAASAAVALTDESGLTSISEALLGTVDIGGRQAGLSVQPNHVALFAALALPVAVWRALRAGERRVAAAWAAVAIVLGGGIVVSESRGGLAVATVAVVAALLADRRARGALPVIAGLGAAGLVVLLLLVPSIPATLAEQLRLDGADSATRSDAIRSAIAGQALADFRHEPVRGVGLEVIVEGHNIYLELLAAGGVLLLAGFLLTMLGALLDAVGRRTAAAGLPAMLGLAVTAWLLGGAVENQVADLALYVPLAVLAGLRAAADVTPPVVAPSIGRA